ncbi:MAG TPA: TPM domain-containing protein [Terriglobales bacterium]|nr:TPM domain-containing protein [Terriglobales bacterium]
MLAAALLLAPVAAQEEPAVPKPRGFVSDYAGVVRPDTVQELTGLITELRQKTGAEIAIAVVKTVQPLTTFDFAMKLAESWQVGSKEHDNGLVFLVAVQDRDMYILTGYGVEGALPDGLVGEIRDTLILPAFRRGDYDGGIRAATYRMAERIAADRGVQLTGRDRPQRPMRRPQGGRPGLGGLLLLLLILFFIGGRGNHLGGRRRRRYGGPFIGGGWGGFGGGGFGGFGGGGGGGFGGFGGGGFGGGGAGGKW